MYIGAIGTTTGRSSPDRTKFAKEIKELLRGNVVAGRAIRSDWLDADIKGKAHAYLRFFTKRILPTSQVSIKAPPRVLSYQQTWGAALPVGFRGEFGATAHISAVSYC